MTKVVAVFGSARFRTDIDEYRQTYEIGYALGAAGFTVMTGGYEGAMEAASKGASEAGSHVIGVASAPIEVLRATKPNQWVKEIINFGSLHERLMYLVKTADAYVVVPGGLGTLTELVLAWELMRVNDIPRRPLVCYGDFWMDILSGLKETQYLDIRDWSCLSVAHSPEEVVNLIHNGDQ